MKLSQPQRAVLERMAEGGVLYVKLERNASGVEETCWIGTADCQPMTVNALITAGLVQEQDEVRRRGGSRTTAYCVSSAGFAALQRQ